MLRVPPASPFRQTRAHLGYLPHVLWARGKTGGLRSFLLCAGAVALAAPGSAQAANLEVINNSDAGAGSLRAAISTANANAESDVITYAPGLSTITLTSGPVVITTPLEVEIRGPGAGSLAVSGNDATSILGVSVGADVKVSGLTLTNGRSAPANASGFGGAVGNAGTLALTDMVVKDSVAVGSNGAAVANGNGNSATGGGIYNHGAGTLSLLRTRVTGNKAIGGAGGGNGTTLIFAGGASGGGIAGEFPGAVTITESEVTSNQAIGGAGGNGTFTIGGSAFGGGMRADGTTTIRRSTFDGNVATGGARGGAVGTNGGGFGGGVYLAAPSSEVTASLFSGNTTTGAGDGSSEGAGVYSAGSTVLSNSTISGNVASGTAPVRNAGLRSSGGTNVTVRGATIAANTAAGGANVLSNGDLTFENTIVADALGGVNCNLAGATLTSAGHNMEDTATCQFIHPTDKPNTDPQLQPLADNGGPTRTQALLPGSPAVDAGSSAGLSEDQRGVARPQDWFAIPNAAGGFDIGAFELQAPARPPAPQLSATDPTSPSASRTLRVLGNAAPGTTVNLYKSPDCTGAVEGTGSAGELASPGLAATVAENGTVQFSATATDPVTGISACSAPLTYVAGPEAACRGLEATIVGTDGADRLRGTGARDVIVAGGGRDRVSAGSGNDVVCGGAGNDTLRGGGGRDKLFGDAGVDRLFGGPARDTLRGGPGRDRQRQ
jgi:hypothetical protein